MDPITPAYGMFTPEGNAAVDRLVEQAAVSPEAYLVLREAVATDYPEINDTAVRLEIAEALIDRTGKSLEGVAAIMGLEVVDGHLLPSLGLSDEDEAAIAAFRAALEEE